MKLRNKTGVHLIAEERARQMTKLNWTEQNDDQYDSNELRDAAVTYLTGDKSLWPWKDYSFKPTSNVRDLTKAGALIAAEIDRLQRIKDE